MERNVIYLYELVNGKIKNDTLNHWQKGYFQLDSSPILCIDKSKYINPIDSFQRKGLYLSALELEQRKIKHFLKSCKSLKLKLINIAFSLTNDDEINEELIRFVNESNLSGINSILSYMESNDEDIEQISFYNFENKNTYNINKYGLLTINANKEEIPCLTDIDPLKLIIGIKSFPITEMKK